MQFESATLPASDIYEYVTPPERIVVHVIAPKIEVEEEEDVTAEEGEEGAAAEPEVAGEGQDRGKRVTAAVRNDGDGS